MAKSDWESWCAVTAKFGLEYWKYSCRSSAVQYFIVVILFYVSLERTTRTRENPGNSSHELGRSLAIVLSVDQLTYMYHSIPTRCSFILIFIEIYYCLLFCVYVLSSGNWNLPCHGPPYYTRFIGIVWRAIFADRLRELKPPT